MNFKISLSARELIFTMVSRVLRQYFKLYIILYENFVYAVSYAFHYAAVYVSMKMDFEMNYPSMLGSISIFRRIFFRKYTFYCIM